MYRRRNLRRPVLSAMVLGATLAAFAPAQARADAAHGPSADAIANVSRYCTTCWRNARVPADLWGDCTQDVFTRLLERLPGSNWQQVLADETEERREFLRAIDAVKKRIRRARKPSGDVAIAADVRLPRVERLAEDRETIRHAATGLLSPRQREVLDRSFDGWSVNEIAMKLSVPAARVSDEKYKAVGKLKERLGAAG